MYSGGGKTSYVLSVMGVLYFKYGYDALGGEDETEEIE